MKKRKKGGFIRFLASILRKSMVTGIPQIANAVSAPSKVIKSLVFIVCLMGFIYQSMAFMNIYWKYETILDIRVENPKVAEMPSITVCANNGIMTSKLCADPEFSSECSAIAKELFNSNKFCDCMPHFCEDGALKNETIPNLSILTNLSYSEYEKYQPYLMPIANLIPFCDSDFKKFPAVEDQCFDYYRNIRCHTDSPGILHACYTIHTLIDRPDGEEEQVSTRTTETLTFDAVDYEYNQFAPNPEVRISIHNSKNILNPYVYGHTLERGHVTLFRLTKTVKRLLPPPYETNCKDYLSEWKTRVGRGPTTDKDCIEECERNSSLEILGCVMTILKGPTNEKICKDYRIDERVLLESQDCVVKNCKPACYEESYEVVKDVAVDDAIGRCFRASDQFKSNAKVVIKLDGLQTTSYIYKPKYQNIETFSYLGGYVGMWLGISLVALFDFLETLVVILRYPFRQIVQQRRRERKLYHIRKF